jgi:hypothetical protein
MIKPRYTGIRNAPSMSDAEMAEVVGRAQKVAQQSERGHSIAEVEQVAAELDLAPQHVATAMAELSHERELADRNTRIKAERWRSRGLIALSVICLLGFASVAVGWSAAADVDAASSDVAQAGARLGSALDRQARTIATQLVAAGARGVGLDPGAATTTAAPRDLAAREAEVAALARAAATALAALPAPMTPAAEQQRLSLTYELTGAENRSAVERARHQAALARWQATSQRWPARVALWLGFAHRPA